MLPASADQGPTISRVFPGSKSQVQTVPSTTETSSNKTVSRATVSRGSVQLPAGDSGATNRGDIAESDVAPTRTAVTRNVTSAIDATTRGNAVTSATPSRAGISRSVTGGANSPRSALEAAANNVGRDIRTKSNDINSTAAVRRAGVTLRPTTAEVGGRAKIAGTDIQTGSNIVSEARSVQNRAAVSQRPTAESIAAATEILEQTASLNKSCQEQYNDCMDQFCAVIDANQKRCSCSANLSRYTKVEEAVKDANTQLNEVAQRIRYVGLSADEIRAIMSATEAEEVLSGTRDTTETRSMLEEIEKLIRSPTSSSSYSADTYTGLDMNLDFSGESNDLFNLDFLGSTSSSFSNLRGTELYNAAKKRCKSVLTQCKTAGATEQQITGNYDLAIDKDCIAYEQGLTKMNESLKNNVRSANQMLQKARLAVLQNKNQYDAKGCIAALNTCMIDDMVCGSDYTKCLDPTKKYIDENGKVVLGQRISDILAFMTSYNNAAIDSTYLKNAENAALNNCSAAENNDGKCIVKYLLQKIGTGKTVSEGGLCRAVLDKCQRVTYNGANNAYDPYNEVVVNYIQRAMVNIQAAQRKIISDYASNCMVDIATCYNQQVSQVNAWSSSANTDSIYNVMRGACRNVSLTCAYAVFADDPTSCPTSGDNAQSTCIDSVSKLFYQSLLCPENSTYQQAKGTPGNDGYVNDRCKCNSGYSVVGRTCALPCNAGTYRDSLSGYCTSCPAGTFSTLSDVSKCDDCPAGTYCPSGSSSATPCPDGMTSPAKSSNVSQCTKSATP